MRIENGQISLNNHDACNTCHRHQTGLCPQLSFWQALLKEMFSNIDYIENTMHHCPYNPGKGQGLRGM